MKWVNKTPIITIKIWIALGSLVLVSAGCDDTVVIINGNGSQIGLMVDGHSSDGPNNDKGYVSNTSSINVGRITQRTDTNEVVAFTKFRPVALQSVNDWKDGKITLNVNFADEIAIPVKIWIVQGPFAQQRQNAIDANLTTAVIWNNERMGVRFSSFEIVDASNESDAPNYYDFTCAKQSGIEADIGKTAGRINIYYVDNVDGGTGRGQACRIGSDFVALGKNSGDELLSHELGHDFSLMHINGLSGNFNQSNVMHSASNTRAYLTEAQVYRAHLDPDSALNFIYHARPGQVTRNCSRDAFTDICPKIERRLWADGIFPAN